MIKIAETWDIVASDVRGRASPGWSSSCDRAYVAIVQGPRKTALLAPFLRNFRILDAAAKRARECGAWYARG